jgi:hypothetical protein
MMAQSVRRLVVAVLLPALLLTSCAPARKHGLHGPDRLSAGALVRSPYVQLHMRDGSFVRLEPWALDVTGTKVSGTGVRLDQNRAEVARGELMVPVDSVVICEAASAEGMPSALEAITVVIVAAAAIALVALLAIAIACASNPKCFGSCPTFYVTDGRDPLLQAEGFSSSIAPSLEATDVDALWRARPRGRTLEVEMRNEALETHVVRSVRVLAARRPPGGRVVATASGELWQALALVPPARAEATEGNVPGPLAAVDGIERVSEPDSSNLGARETVELEYPPTPGPLGLVVASRQTLLTTYLFYETLSAMGPSAGAMLASLERSDRSALQRATALGRALGGIEVQVPGEGGEWRTVETVSETGPLATDVKLVRLPEQPAGPVRMRLRAARGMFRLDAALLARLGERVEPVRLEPVEVRRGDARDEDAKSALLDDKRTIVTSPGDTYSLRYRLPDDASRLELFLESRGYYLEWMREPWMKGGDPARLATLLLDPDRALRDLAPAYARERAGLEEWFWRSRYVHP